MTAQDYAQSAAFIGAIFGDVETTVVEWRAIHDKLKDIPAIPFRGTLAQCWQSILTYNGQGYGIFCTPAEMDGQGRELANVRRIFAHYVDLDNLSAQQNYERATIWQPAPSFAVASSPGKYHVYWQVEPYSGNDRFTLLQRKLRQVFDGDRIIDATRVMRVPGTLHAKGEPSLVKCWSLAGYGQRHSVEALEGALAAVNVIDAGGGSRHELGDTALAAPSLDWLRYSLSLIDPNELDRSEWVALTAAVKQSGWTLATPETLYQIWAEWCAKYDKNDTGENLKQWDSLRQTQLGWQSIVARVPALKAMVHLGGREHAAPVLGEPHKSAAPPMPVPTPPALDCSGPMLTDLEQRKWFEGVTYITNLGMMLTPKHRFLNTGQFNVEYGGKDFIFNMKGNTTDEAWKAATRSTLWTVPRVDHIRFLPEQPYGKVIVDDLGRKGINVYKPATVHRMNGDPSPFLQHIARILPNPSDQRVLLDYMAHNIKYPGYKIPWMPVIQSAEGVGKGAIKLVMRHALGKPYVYFPNAIELAASGAKFNAWLRNRLFILVDEIRVDEKRQLLEILKPLVSEEETEVQAKGVDQDLEDNFSNWMSFTNWKDSIPVNRNNRRWSIFYSPFQTAADLLRAGMDDAYYDYLYNWLKGEGNHPHGAAIVTDYFLNYPIERGAIPKRAPWTSSMDEAIKLSRGPIERLIIEAVEDGLPGFLGGYVSSLSVAARIKASGARVVSPGVIDRIMGDMGYIAIGRAPRAYFQEDAEAARVNNRPNLFHVDGSGRVEDYGRVQGWE